MLTKPARHESEKHPQRVPSNTLSSFNIRKGVLDSGLQVTMMDYVGPCVESKCPAARHCVYKSSPLIKLGCRVELLALEDFSGRLLAIANKANDPMLVHAIGWDLIELFHQQLRLMKVVIGLEDDELVSEDRTGKKNIHPVFKEIREVIKARRDALQRSGLTDAAEALGFSKNYLDASPNPKAILRGHTSRPLKAAGRPGGSFKPGTDTEPGDEQMRKGDPDFYERMATATSPAQQDSSNPQPPTGEEP